MIDSPIQTIQEMCSRIEVGVVRYLSFVRILHHAIRSDVTQGHLHWEIPSKYIVFLQEIDGLKCF